MFKYLKFMQKTKTIIALYLIVLLGFSLRIFGINWDNGYHMHPDERAIILTVVGLDYPTTASEFVSSESPWNPKFFAYGSFPFYLLRIAGDTAGFTIDIKFAEYDSINIVGRFLSAIFDTGTIIIVFLIAKNLRGRKAGLISAFVYSVSVLPIQLAHFYAVDTLLTFLITSVLYLLLKLLDNPSIGKSIAIGFLFGLALATKISVSVLLPSVLLALCLEFVILFLKSPHKPSRWLIHFPKTIKRLFIFGGIIFTFTIATFITVQPYALLDKDLFVKQLLEQSQMTRDPYTFPYTLQYVGKIPYVYELKNILLYGLGPFLGTLGITGTAYIFYRAVFKTVNFPWQKSLILLQFFLTYFLITGSFSIGFMRYMLPLYPLFAIFIGILICDLCYKFKDRQKIILPLFLVLSLVWAIMFLSIYTRPNTRIQASTWIHKNIPPGSIIATEHWDDVLPLTGQDKYKILSLALYEPESMEKWDIINRQLDESDYIIIASNRLFEPLSKLTDCPNIPPGRCYVRSALYYKELFAEKAGFKKVAEITSFPSLPFTNALNINDQAADESFTVYDHPRIMIFKKK